LKIITQLSHWNKKYLPYLLLLIVPFFPLFLKNYQYGILLLCFAEIYIIATTGVDIVYGYSGQITFATSAFFGIGAYSSQLLHTHFNLPLVITIPIASLIGCIIALIFAIPVSKLRFAFLSLSTISFAYVVYQLITRSPGGITGDFNGLFVERIVFFNNGIDRTTQFYYFGLICVILFVGLKILLVRSRVGRAFLAIKQNVHAAEGMGINVRKYKVYAFGVYGLYAAFAGTLYGHLVGFISPETVAETQSVLFLIMAMFGGLASNWGPLIGATSIVLLNDALSHFEQYQLLAYGVILIVFIVFIPDGVVGLIRRITSKINEKPEKVTNVEN
jgi:branched-chain amino acid transport system permease protein